LKAKQTIRNDISPNDKLPAVVAYARVSTDNQKDEGTIQLQKDALQEYCANRFDLKETFADEGISGGLEDRPALVAMFDYLEAHPEVKSVIIWKLDRLARDLYIQEHLIKKLEAMGVTLISIKEANLDSGDPMRKAFRQFMGIVSELEKSFITMRLREGRKAKAKKGLYAGGGLAYGFDSKEKDLVVADDQATVVRDIFRMRINHHHSYERIAATLNAQGVSTKRGGRWNPGTVHYMIRNPKYKGMIAYSGETVERSELAIV
jgi:DNA invertase Pin-like site-specific DNA recombinase